MRFEVKAPDGRTVVLEGDSRPTDADLDEIFSNLPEKQLKQEQFTAEQIESARIKGQEMLKNSGVDTSLNSVANAFADGFSKGYIGGAERVGSGATFGLTDWIGDKLGTGVKERRKELEDASGAITALNAGLDIVGGIPTGGALFKGLSAGAKAIPYAGRVLKYAVPTAGGAITGGLYSGFGNDSLDSAGTGALTGGLVAGALDAGLRGAGKLFSAVEKVKNTPRGFENAVGTKEGARILNRAVRESDDIAERVYGKAPEALDNLNVRAMDKLDDAVKGGVDVKGRMAGAKKAYGDFIDENKANQIIEGKFTPAEYQANLMKWSGGKEPIKVYHGTNKEFDVFDLSAPKKTDGGLMGNAIYVSPQKEYAQTYGKNLKELYINPKKTLTLSDTPREELKRILKGEISPKNQTNKEIAEKLGKYVTRRSDVKKTLYDLNMEKGLYDDAIIDVLQSNKDASKILKELGYDSTKFISSDGSVEYALYNPLNLKSVQNSGAFTNTASLTDKGVKPLAKVSDLGITGLTDNQKSWLNQAWVSGKRNTLEKAGSLGHLDEMSKELNKMVQSSRLANPNGVGTVATPETVALQGLKDKVDDVIEKAGLQNIKSQYRQAKALEDSFNQGLNFNPNSVKTRNITFKTPDEQSAFAQGLVEKVKMNPETKNIAGKTRDLRGALRKALGEKADGVFKEMDNINKSYKNVEKVLGNAERKLSVPEPINGKIGLLREFVESPGSVIGGLADFARRWGTAKSAERAAKYLLDPTLKLGNSPYEAIRQYAPTIGGLGIGNLIRKGE